MSETVHLPDIRPRPTKEHLRLKLQGNVKTAEASALADESDAAKKLEPLRKSKAALDAS
jgi:hypothetical protein